MVEKIIFCTEEESFILKIFDDQTIINKNKTIPVTFHNKFKHLHKNIISYSTLSKKFIQLKTETITNHEIPTQSKKRTNTEISTNIPIKKLRTTSNNQINHETNNNSTKNSASHINQFLNSTFAEPQSFYRINANLKSFLHKYDLFEYRIPSDGLCFTNAIRHYFSSILSIQLEFEEIKALIKSFFEINKIQEYNGLSDSNYIKRLNIDLSEHFDKKVEINMNENYLQLIIKRIF